MQIFSLGFTSGAFVGVGTNADTVLRQVNFVDRLSVQKGSHGLKLGVDFRRLSPDYNVGEYAQSGSFTTVPQATTGNSLSTMLISHHTGTLLFRNLGLFAQDTWRASRHLTLTYGLRWDVDFTPSSIRGPNLDALSVFSLTNLSALTKAPKGTPAFSTRYGNVAPRVGVAYQLSQSQNWQTVLRGGFGVFYDLATEESGQILPLNSFPFGATQRLSGVAFPLASPNNAPPPITPANLATGALAAFDPNLKLPYTLQSNVAFEQSLGRQHTLSSSYIGSAGRRLTQTAFLVFPNPSIFLAQLVTNTGASGYNALQLQFQRRLSHVLQALASSTWSH